MSTRKYTTEEVQSLKKSWDDFVAKLRSDNIALNDLVKQRISQKDFDLIVQYIKEHEDELFAKASIFSNGFQLNTTVSGLPRSLSIRYDPETKTFSVKIWLKNKLSDYDADGKSVKIDPDNIKVGAENGFSNVLTIEEHNGKLSANIGTGILVKKTLINKSIAQSNDDVIKEANLQNALSKFKICLPLTLLPPGKSGKISKEVSKGDSLWELVESGNITHSELIKYYKQIIEKLAKLHALGIVHGDIKPENIIVYKGEAYLADLDTLGFVDKLHVPQGTPGYLLPCQILVSMSDTLPSEQRKAISYSFEADMYALAILIKDANDKVDLGQADRNLTQIYRDISKFLDVGNYTHRVGDVPKESVILADLYKEILGKDFEFDVDGQDKNNVSNALRDIDDSRNIRSVYNLIHKNSKASLGNLLALYRNHQDDLSGSLNHLFGFLGGISFEYFDSDKLKDAVNFVLDFENGLLSSKFAEKYLSLMQKINSGDLTDLNKLHDEMLMMNEAVEWLIMQSQLHNYIKKGDLNEGLIDVDKLCEVSNACKNISETLQSIRRLKANKNHSLLLSIPNASDLSHGKQHDLIEQCRIVMNLDNEYRKNANKDGAAQYALNLIKCGDAFSNLDLDAFRSQSPEKMQQMIFACGKHINVLGESTRMLGLEHPLADALDYPIKDRVRSKLDCMKQILFQHKALHSGDEKKI